jgi:hypothetical protein
LYDGFFLDRMRYPSPAADPINSLTCFCEHCYTVGVDFGVDLGAVRNYLENNDCFQILEVYFGAASKNIPLKAFLDLRKHNITDFISAALNVLRSSSLEVGLDCFSPSFTRMVGQDLEILSPLADWTK